MNFIFLMCIRVFALNKEESKSVEEIELFILTDQKIKSAALINPNSNKTFAVKLKQRKDILFNLMKENKIIDLFGTRIYIISLQKNKQSLILRLNNENEYIDISIGPIDEKESLILKDLHIQNYGELHYCKSLIGGFDENLVLIIQTKESERHLYHLLLLLNTSLKMEYNARVFNNFLNYYFLEIQQLYFSKNQIPEIIQDNEFKLRNMFLDFFSDIDDLFLTDIEISSDDIILKGHNLYLKLIMNVGGFLNQINYKIYNYTETNNLKLKKEITNDDPKISDRLDENINRSINLALESEGKMMEYLNFLTTSLKYAQKKKLIINQYFKK